MIKKLYIYIFIICLTLCSLISFTPSASKAAIVQPNLNNGINASNTEFDSTISDFQLFNSFDYTYVDSINVDLHFTSNNLISTNIDPTQTTTTTYSAYCFGSLCYSQTFYYIKVPVYYYTSGGTTRIMYFSFNEFTYGTQTYNNTTCRTLSYINNTITTSNGTRTLIFTNQSKWNNYIINLDTAHEDQNDLLLGSGTSLANAITNMESNTSAKLLYQTNTGLSNSATSKTSTCTSSQSTSYTCNSNFNSTYTLNYYGISLGTASFNLTTRYDSGYSKCITSSIGTNIDNGYYFSYSLDFNNLDRTTKRNIWNALTQRNSTPDFEEYTITLNSGSNYFTAGINLIIYMQIKFTTNINYQYNNFYIKFNSNNNNTIKYLYYGDYDLLINYTTNNQYTNYTLIEKSKIYGDNIVILSDNKITNNYSYLDYNFNIALLSDALLDQFISEHEKLNCEWYQFMCHVKNFFTTTVYDIPILSNFYVMFESIVSTTGTVINVLIDYKEVAFIGSVVILSLCYHFIKRSTE